MILCCTLAGCIREDLASDKQNPPDASPPMPRPYRKRLETAVSLNAECVSCHEEQASEWRGSHHQRSNTNPAYREAFAIEPTAFCRGCHAPESNPTKEPPKAVSELGVGCVSCHVTEEGLVLAAPSSSSGHEALPSPHPLRRSREFAETGGCAGCHEFRFPEGHGNDDGQFMQSTSREHQRSPAAKKPCAACHMPLVEGRRSHAFSEVRDPAWLRKNLEAKAERVEENIVRITLVQPDPGHAFPSGDLFRRLEIGCELRSADGKVLRRESRYLARHFEMFPGSHGRELTRDNRVFSEPKVVEMDLTPPSPTKGPSSISYWVSYQRVATPGTGMKPSDAKIESEVRLHAGILP